MHAQLLARPVVACSVNSEARDDLLTFESVGETTSASQNWFDRNHIWISVIYQACDRSVTMEMVADVGYVLTSVTMGNMLSLSGMYKTA